MCVQYIICVQNWSNSGSQKYIHEGPKLYLVLVLEGISCWLLVNLYVTKSSLDHSSERMDPSPRHPSDLPLIGHWNVLYLHHRYGKGQSVQVALHLATHSL